MIDFTENIESLEKMVWNFIFNEDNDQNELKPKKAEKETINNNQEEIIIEDHNNNNSSQNNNSQTQFNQNPSNPQNNNKSTTIPGNLSEDKINLAKDRIKNMVNKKIKNN